MYALACVLFLIFRYLSVGSHLYCLRPHLLLHFDVDYYRTVDLDIGRSRGQPYAGSGHEFGEYSLMEWDCVISLVKGRMCFCPMISAYGGS